MKCKCGHAENDHTTPAEVALEGESPCSECEECTGFEAAEEDVVHSDFAEKPGTADGDVNVLAEPPAPPGPPVEYTVVVELHNKEPGPRRLIKFSGFQQALSSPLVPHSSRIWVSRATFLANADPLEYEDLVDFHDAAQKAVSDDVQVARMTLKSRMFDRLLEIAWTPEQAATHLGVRATKEGKVPRKKKEDGAPPKEKTNGTRSYSKLDPKTKIEKLVDKNPAREGSATAERFGLIKNGMTVEGYVKAGGKATFLTYFEKAGHIKLTAPSA